MSVLLVSVSIYGGLFSIGFGFLFLRRLHSDKKLPHSLRQALCSSFCGV
jgi:hypothetical protein